MVLIEADALFHRPLLRALHQAGCRVELTTSGHGALTATTRTDLVILDLDGLGGPDGSDGLQLCRQLRARADTLPILILAARTGLIDQAVGLDYGGSDYLPKPFRVATFLARVQALLQQRGSPGPAWHGRTC